MWLRYSGAYHVELFESYEFKHLIIVETNTGSESRFVVLNYDTILCVVGGNHYFPG
jgi:hypothetical protein